MVKAFNILGLVFLSRRRTQGVVTLILLVCSYSDSMTMNNVKLTKEVIILTDKDHGVSILSSYSRVSHVALLQGNVSYRP